MKHKTTNHKIPNQKTIQQKTIQQKKDTTKKRYSQKKIQPKKDNNRTEWKNINRMAYPVLLNYLLTNLFELLDKAMIGHYSIHGFAVAGTAASAIYAVTGALGILSVSFHIVAAAKKGKQDELGFETAFFISKHLTWMIGMCFFIASILGGHLFFQNIYGIQGNDLAELLSYFYPAAFTVLQNMLLFQYSAYFRNCLNTRITLFSTAVSTGVNLFFDVSLIYGLFGLPQLGTSGAAWGSVIGLSAGLLVYQIPYYRKRALFQTHRTIQVFRIFRKNFSLLKEILNTYPSLLGQELLENSIFLLIISGVVARLGTEQMAVYHLLETLGSMIGLPIYAYASAVQTFTLQNHSAGNTAAVNRYLKSGILLASGVIFVLCVLCAIFQTKILHWIVTDSKTVTASRHFLLLVFAVQFFKIPYQIYLHYLQGIGKERFVFVCTVFGTITAGLGTVILARWLGLSAVYFILALEFGILSLIYRKVSI